MTWRVLGAVLCAGLIVLGSLGPVAGSVGGVSAVDGADTQSEAPVAESAPGGDGTATQLEGTDAPPDPDEDVLGWENGVWYNESVSIDQSEGLSESELAFLLNRSMARVERIRELEFRETPTVNFLTRSEYRDVVNRSFSSADITDADRLHQNTKFEALFLVGEDTEYFDVAEQNQGGIATAFFVTQDAPEIGLAEGEIGIILDDGTLPQLNEQTLAHEVTHALQNQQFNTSQFVPRTEDESRALDGLTEGDAHYVEALYQQRCESEWDCVTPPGDDSDPPEFANLGLVLYDLVPYGNGPAFVQQIHQQDGWEAVNDLYENPPRTSAQLIHPDSFPAESPNVTITDRSSEEWRVLELEDGVNYATFGEAGLFTMLWYPSFQEQGQVIIGPNAPFTGRSIDPYDFAHPATDGWEGDKLLPYVTDESGETGETGYVWKLVWESTDDAREFSQAYQRLLEYRNAEQVDAGTFQLPASDGEKSFDDAIYAQRSGDTVTIVNAPTVDELSAVSSVVTNGSGTPVTSPATAEPTASPAETDDGPTAEPTVSPDETGDGPTGTAADTGGDPTPTSATGSGFAVVSVVVALLALLVFALGRRR
jgi:hypothetical protein